MMDHWPLNCVRDILAELEWVCLKYALSNKRRLSEIKKEKNIADDFPITRETEEVD